MLPATSAQILHRRLQIQYQTSPFLHDHQQIPSEAYPREPMRDQSHQTQPDHLPIPVTVLTKNNPNTINAKKNKKKEQLQKRKAQQRVN